MRVRYWQRLITEIIHRRKKRGYQFTFTLTWARAQVDRNLNYRL
jgi:hypothetical protein